jgi:ribosomal protein L7/L12
LGGKINAIKAVRDYCIKVNYDKYIGLKDAKDHVEYVRGDWYYAHRS